MWPGKLLAKGVLDPKEAKAYLDLGADGLVISNHGGRQLDAAPSAVSYPSCLESELPLDLRPPSLPMAAFALVSISLEC